MTAILWDAATGTIAYTLVHDTPVISVAFSPDSTKLLTVTLSGNLHLWDTASGAGKFSGYQDISPVARGQFSPDGQYVVSDGEEGGIIVWECKLAMCCDKSMHSRYCQEESGRL